MNAIRFAELEGHDTGAGACDADRDAYETKVELAKREGLLVGISAGAAVFVARRVAAELGPGKTIVTILCDTGERYFSLDEYFA